MSSSTAAPFSARSMLIPLAAAQFIASYAATNMNVAVNPIAHDLGTTVIGVQTAITLFTLTMAALMIPGSKLTDIWGRRTCFRIGLVVYGIGALLAALAPGMTTLIIGYSLLEGIGSALMIPPIYILVTVYSPDLATRARALGAISAAAGVGAATGPLIGGLVTSAISWRASFLLQVLMIAAIIISSRRILDMPVQEPRPRFDFAGAVLTAAGLFFIVLGVLQSGTYGWFVAAKNFEIGGVVIIHQGGISPVWLFVAIGALSLLGYVLYARRSQRMGRAPLLPLQLFRNRTSNLGLVTQNVQWLVLQGSFFVVSVFLQTVQNKNSIETGLILTAATIGILVASALAGRMARNRTQRFLIRGGFVTTLLGMSLLLALASQRGNVASFLPGLFLMGLGVGVMLTASANVVQSAFPEKQQGEISGLSRSVSNLGSSLGTAIAGSVLVEATSPTTYGFALIVLGVITFIGLGAAVLLPAAPPQAATSPKGRPVVAS